jgi:hypothetical protein
LRSFGLEGELVQLITKKIKWPNIKEFLQIINDTCVCDTISGAHILAGVLSIFSPLLLLLNTPDYRIFGS